MYVFVEVLFGDFYAHIEYLTLTIFFTIIQHLWELR